VVSLPTKLLLWSWKVDNHDISPETEAMLATYLAENDLGHVKVRLNQYAPAREWSRLFRNREVGGFWRYTLGFFTVASYMILPGRFFGGDHYNPYTNSIHLYSDSPSIAIHEAGHAKDFAGTSWKGLYAAVRLLPIVPLFQEAEATGDAIGYHRDREDRDLERADYKILYPAYATYVAGEALRFVSTADWVYYAATYALAIPGHIIGRIKAARVPDAIAEAPDEATALEGAGQPVGDRP
jgi:hypothetical protein